MPFDSEALARLAIAFFGHEMRWQYDLAMKTLLPYLRKGVFQWYDGLLLPPGHWI
jgi:hypothetical protein